MKRFIVLLMSLTFIFQLYSMEETTELISAVKKDNIQRVTKLLERHENINVQDKRGNTPLSAAARTGSLALVKLLLANGAQIDLCNNDALCPLHSAVMGGHLEIAKLLLDHGADVNAADNYRGRTPLLWVGRMTEGAPKKSASQIPVEKSVQLTKLLLAQGADPARVDFTGKTALDWAKIFKLQPLVVVLTNAANDKAAARGHRAMVQAQNATPKTNAQQFKLASSEPTTSPKKVVAVSQKTMATAPAKVKDISNMTIWEAAAAGDMIAFNRLIIQGQSLYVKNKYGETLLMVAAGNGQDEIVNKLLTQWNADVNNRDIGNATALMHAALHGHANTVKLLIEWGANVAAEDSIGRRALDYAQNAQNEATIDLLKEAEENEEVFNESFPKTKIAAQQPQIKLSKAEKKAAKALKKAASKAQSEADKAKNKAAKLAKEMSLNRVIIPDEGPCASICAPIIKDRAEITNAIAQPVVTTKKLSRSEKRAASRAQIEAYKPENKIKKSLPNTVIVKPEEIAPIPAVSPASAECYGDIYECWYEQEGYDDAPFAALSPESDFAEFEDWQDDYNYKSNGNRNWRGSDFSPDDIGHNPRNKRDAQKSRNQDWHDYE